MATATKDEGTRTKRYRATNAEMQEREDAVFRALDDSREPLTIQALSAAVDLPYAKAAALVRRLTDSGRVTMLGREGRQILFTPSDRAEAKEENNKEEPKSQNGTQVERATAPRAEQPSARTLPPVDVNAILEAVHLGEQVEVSGLRLHKDAGAVIDLTTPDGRIVTVSVVEAE